MQYAYIKLSKKGKSLFGRTRFNTVSCGNNIFHIIESTERKDKLEKKLIKTGIDRYLSDEEFPRLDKYNPRSFYRYFAPQVFRYMYKNYPSDRLVICSDIFEDTLYLISKLSNYKMEFCTADESMDNSEKMLEFTGIPLISAKTAKDCILIRFGGRMPVLAENVHIADFENSRFIFEENDESIDYACMMAEYMNINKENTAEHFHLIKII